MACFIPKQKAHICAECNDIIMSPALRCLIINFIGLFFIMKCSSYPDTTTPQARQEERGQNHPVFVFSRHLPCSSLPSSTAPHPAPYYQHYRALCHTSPPMIPPSASPSTTQKKKPTVSPLTKTSSAPQLPRHNIQAHQMMISAHTI